MEAKPSRGRVSSRLFRLPCAIYQPVIRLLCAGKCRYSSPRCRRLDVIRSIAELQTKSAAAAREGIAPLSSRMRSSSKLVAPKISWLVDLSALDQPTRGHGDGSSCMAWYIISPLVGLKEM